MRSREFDERDRAVLDTLLKQYEFIRTEIIQSIYLKHAAIIGLYSFLGLSIIALTREDSIDVLTILGSILNLKSIDLANSDLGEIILFLSILIFVQIIVSGFGSLYLKEQARNRRACSFQKAIEYLINEKTGEIGFYWENYITSELIVKKLERIDYFRSNISVIPEYYKNRFLGVGLPVFLPNAFVTFLIGLMLHALYSENLIFHVFIFFLLFVASLGITYFWAWMILKRSRYALKEENMPSGKDVFKWLKKEQSKITLEGVSSTFTLEDDMVELEIYVVRDRLSREIWDIEIFPEDQELPWKSVEGVKAPEGWKTENKDNRVKFYTERNPPGKREPLKFRFKVNPEKMIGHIRVHLTDRNHKTIGEIVSQLGVFSTFTHRDGEVELEIHVVTDELSKKIYHIEIFPKDQKPPWKKIECKNVKLPEGWKCQKAARGVRFYTETKPLLKCQRTKFKFKVQPKRVIKDVRLHLTDRNYRSLGDVVVSEGIF